MKQRLAAAAAAAAAAGERRNGLRRPARLLGWETWEREEEEWRKQRTSPCR
jgi:hypothetical protein